MKIIHVISSLGNGGAEKVLYEICTQTSNHDHIIISLLKIDIYGELLRSKGFKVFELGMKRGSFPSPFNFFKLVQLIKRHKPDIVQTWMYHSDLLGGIAARLAGIDKVIWGIRNSYIDPKIAKKSTIWTIKILSRLSWWLPFSIIVNSQKGLDYHVSIGYRHTKMRRVLNGCDIKVFKFTLKDAFVLRKKWGVESNVPLIGFVARYHPQKNHYNLLCALTLLQSRNILPYCVFVGSNIKDNKKLINQINQFGLKKTIILEDSFKDISSVMSALDLHILPSASEGFPNVVLEAMACETPCVVTDVGDAAYIVGDTGWVVKPNSPKELADAIEKALIERQKNKWQNRCKAARKRIENHFDIQKMLVMYKEVWIEAENKF